MRVIDGKKGSAGQEKGGLFAVAETSFHHNLLNFSESDKKQGDTRHILSG